MSQTTISQCYHSIFGYKLNSKEEIRWKAGKNLIAKKRILKPKKILKEKFFENKAKLLLAQKASEIISKLPFVLFVGITGSLAMNSASKSSDIDLMIITRKNCLWATRPIVYFLLIVFGLKLRRSGSSLEKDKLCLNFWIDESKLLWEEKKSAYIAHEIAQVVPLVNRQKIWERWLWANAWVLNFWPNAVIIRRAKATVPAKHKLFYLPNLFCYLIQLTFMKSKMTRESVSISHAYFHPMDWGEKVTQELHSMGVWEVVE